MRLGILALAAALLLLTACSPRDRGTDFDVMTGGFVGGTEGLLVRVVEGAPPPVIFDAAQTPFSFILALENLGEADVGPGTENPFVLARLTGIAHKDFSTTQESSEKQLATRLASAKRNFDGSIFPGEIAELGFEDLAYKPDVFDSIGLAFRAEVCYDYETRASVKMCFKKDPIESSEDSSICMLKGPRPFGVSGAPVQVTRVEQSPVNANTINVKFGVENLGRGVFFSRDYSDKHLCSFLDTNPAIYKLEISVAPQQKDTYSISCPRLSDDGNGGVSGVVRMPSNSPLSVNCFLSRTSPSTQRVYEDILNIRIKYRYGEFIEVPVLIQGHY